MTRYTQVIKIFHWNALTWSLQLFFNNSQRELNVPYSHEQTDVESWQVENSQTQLESTHVPPYGQSPSVWQGLVPAETTLAKMYGDNFISLY